MNNLTPMKSIRAKCLDCQNGSKKEIRLCQITTCALHPYRMGRNPRREGIGNTRPRAGKPNSAREIKINSGGVVSMDIPNSKLKLTLSVQSTEENDQ